MREFHWLSKIVWFCLTHWMKTSPLFLYEQLFLLWKHTERKINLKRHQHCRLGQLWKSRKMTAPPNKLAYREDGNGVCQTEKCGIAFGQQQANDEETADWKTLIWQRKQWKSHFVRTYMYLSLPAGSGSFLSCSVLFFEQNMLDAEQGIQNYKFRRAWQTAKFITSWKRVNIWKHYFFGTPLQGQDFCWEIKVHLVHTIVLSCE